MNKNSCQLWALPEDKALKNGCPAQGGNHKAGWLGRGVMTKTWLLSAWFIPTGAAVCVWRERQKKRKKRAVVFSALISAVIKKGNIVGDAFSRSPSLFLKDIKVGRLWSILHCVTPDQTNTQARVSWEVALNNDSDVSLPPPPHSPPPVLSPCPSVWLGWAWRPGGGVLTGRQGLSVSGG